MLTAEKVHLQFSMPGRWTGLKHEVLSKKGSSLLPLERCDFWCFLDDWCWPRLWHCPTAFLLRFLTTKKCSIDKYIAELQHVDLKDSLLQQLSLLQVIRTTTQPNMLTSIVRTIPDLKGKDFPNSSARLENHHIRVWLWGSDASGGLCIPCGQNVDTERSRMKLGLWDCPPRSLPLD